MSDHLQGLFEEVVEFPDPRAARRYANLVGLDETKERLLKEAQILLDSASTKAWSEKHHKAKLRLVDLFHERPPLFIFAGDVGTGKTALAETFGDPVARKAGIGITLYALSLSSRGRGVVGEMTTLLSAAFAEVKQAAKQGTGRSGKHAKGVILLIDEADALAQSREAAQMHHEDRAGVNALIRGIDDFANGTLPGIVVMCTNRIDAIDPAVRRRAAATISFGRPNDEQREAVLAPYLEELAFTPKQIKEIVVATGPNAEREYGCTYSDLTQRLLPAFLLAAYPSKPITFDLVQQVIEQHPPTPPFRNELMK